MNGFFLANPNGLWAFTAVLAVAVLYLFHRRYRPRAVTGLFLWGRQEREGTGGRKLEKPRPGRSLLFDLLAAALLALAFCGPAFKRDSGLPLALILDDRFSMRARDGHIEASRLAAEIFASAADRGVEYALITAGRRPRLELGMRRGSGTETAEPLRNYLPAADAGSLREAVALARGLYGRNLDIHLISNRDEPAAAFGGGPLTLHVLPGRGGNLAILRAWREPDASGHRERLVLILANHGPDPVPATLTVAAAPTPDAPFHSQAITLPAGGTGVVEAVVSLAADVTLLARVTAAAEADVIPDDSRAYVAPAPRRVPTYLVEGLTPAAERSCVLALEAAGCVPAPWENETTPPPDILVTSDPEARGRILTLEIPPSTEPGVFSPPYVVDTAGPLCRDVNLAAVPWVVANREAPERVSEAYILAGDMPLYWRSASERLHMNLVPERCLIVSDAAWPVLFANLAAEAAARLPGLAAVLYLPGETVRFNPVPGLEESGLSLLSGDRVEASGLGRAFPAPRNPGWYRLRLGNHDAGEFSVIPNFGEASDTTLLAPSPRTLVEPGPGAGAGEGSVDLTWLALGLGVAFLLLNWRKGNTVQAGRGDVKGE